MARKKAEAATATTPVVNLVLNKAAATLFGDMEFARVRIQDDKILVKPSIRTKGIGNLPKPDIMVKLLRTSKGIRLPLPLPGEVEAGTIFLIEERKRGYGWTEFTVGEPSGRDTPVARVIGPQSKA